MTAHTRTLDRFEYHLEDVDCDFCLHSKPKRKGRKTCCGEDPCHYEDIRLKAAENGRIKRKRGYFKMPDKIISQEVAYHAQ
ncbi:MAG: hypothetical protein FWC20_07625 [Oscillospiraceae bacterium]|nr:hypothetical protein [Oscillospiraceae bacterium]MCL2279258.1 hypothetical protein [Oscillospiraceae bacterium]